MGECETAESLHKGEYIGLTLYISVCAVSWTEESWMRVLADIEVQWLLVAGFSEYLVYLRSSFSVTKDLHILKGKLK